jgi:hypothetical protein
MSRAGRTFVALGGAGLVLVIAAWFDHVAFRNLVKVGAANFDPMPMALGSVIGSLLVAGSALLVGALAWRAASGVVAVAYVLVGGFIVALPWLTWTFAAGVNGTPAVLPEELADVLGDLYFDTTGTLNAVGTIGGAMLIIGIVVLVRKLRDRGVEARSAEAIIAGPDANPAAPGA